MFGQSQMIGTDGRSRFFIGVSCWLLVVAAVGSGVLVGADGPTEPEDERATAMTVDADGFSISPAASAVGPSVVQIDGVFETPSETVGEPELDVFLSDPTIEPGTEKTVELTILNTGSIEEGSTLDDDSATARGVSLSINDDDAPVDVSPTETGVGSIAPGESVSIPVTVTAPASADGDDGEIDIEVDYTYTEYDDNGDASDESETDSFDVGVAVSSRARFSIADVETDAQVGTDGIVDVEIENIGEEDATDVRVSARSPTGGVTIGVPNGGQAAGTEPDDRQTDGEQSVNNGDTDESITDERSSTEGSAAFLGELDDGDDETVSFDTRIDSDVAVESYLLELTVVYEDEDGILKESTTLATAVEPTAGQTFEISAAESTLQVGDSGTISVDLANTGPASVEMPVVRAEPASDRIDIGEDQVALESLDENGTAEVSFDADVSGEADPGPRPVRFTVEYGIDGNRLESDPFVRRVAVADDQPAFEITADDAEVPAGTTETVSLTITNNRNETLSNINVFLYPDGPLSVDTDEAYIAELEPNERETLAVDVSANEGAEQRSYPLDADLRYDDETDEDLISQVYQVPITVTEPPDDDGLLPSLVSIAGLVALLVGVVFVRRRR